MSATHHNGDRAVGQTTTDDVSMTSEALREAGLRATRQRATVLDALRGRPDAITAQDLHGELRAGGEPVGLTTVYRTLASLADAGLLDAIPRDGEQAFRLCSEDHHHHLICESCDRVDEITAEEVERWVDAVASRRGFHVTGHRADIFGLCAGCGTSDLPPDDAQSGSSPVR
ncbi:MAG TPA: Fur family transcriptional regulator [Euzebyales bacterium]